MSSFAAQVKLIDYSHDDITVWIAQVYVKTEGRLDYLQNFKLMVPCIIIQY